MAGIRDISGLATSDDDRNLRLSCSRQDLIDGILAVAEEERVWWEGVAVETKGTGEDRKVVQKEATKAGRERIAKYHDFLFGDDYRYAATGGRFDPAKQAWSGVFISYCIATAHIELRGREGSLVHYSQNICPLLVSQAHWFYSQRAYRRRSDKDGGYYWAFMPDVPLQVGDIVVKKYRKPKDPVFSDLSVFSDLKDGSRQDTHGDIVVELATDETGGRIAAVIGGNVSHSVSKTRYELTAAGRIRRCGDANDALRVFCVLRLVEDRAIETSSGMKHRYAHKPEVAAWIEEERVRESEPERRVEFPSGLCLCVAGKVPVATRRDPHWHLGEQEDERAVRYPLLKVAGKAGARLSDNFTVGELVGSQEFARIDPRLVEGLQRLRDLLKRPILVEEGYRQWKDEYLRRKKRGKVRGVSGHIVGTAARIRVRGVTPVALAKRTIDAFGPKVGIGLGAADGALYVDAYPSGRTLPLAGGSVAAGNADVQEVDVYRRAKFR